MNADETVVELSVEDCWALLRDEEFGRLAYRLVDEVHVVPIKAGSPRARRTGSTPSRAGPGSRP